MPVTVAAAVVLVVVAPGGFAAYHIDRAHLDTLPTGTRIGGLDVSGLGRGQAVAAVGTAIARERERATELRVAGHVFRTTPHRLGVTDDVPAVVDAAFAEARRGTWLSRTWRRVTRADPPRIAVPVGLPSAPAVRAFVDRAARATAIAPVDAAATVGPGGLLSFVHARAGARLDPAAAEAAVRAAVADGRPRTVAVRPVAPKVRDATFRTTLLVRTGENRLYLYQSERLTRTFPVATGMPAYPTPTGQFRITLKRFRPTWVNPSPRRGWGASMPAVIPPGPSNPLGTRALNVSAPGIRIHGTSAAGSIGYNASHGCLRMRMPDVEALFPLVPTGAPVVITRGGGSPRVMAGAAAGSTAAA